MFFRTRAYNELRLELARVAGAVEVMKDHENRLRRMERYMYAIPASLIMAAGSVVVAWYQHH